jgi:hypothetical protein
LGTLESISGQKSKFKRKPWERVENLTIPAKSRVNRIFLSITGACRLLLALLLFKLGASNRIIDVEEI